MTLLDNRSPVCDDAFLNVAGRWAALGVWCAQWTCDGRLLGPQPQDSSFWRTLWHHVPEFRESLAGVAGGTGVAAPGLMGVSGLQAQALPVVGRQSDMRVVVCFLDHHFALGETLHRLCGNAEIDALTLQAWSKDLVRFGVGQGEVLAHLLSQELRGERRRGEEILEVDEMTTQLAAAYEELNLIYRIAASMRVTHRPRTHFESLFQALAHATPFTTMAAVLYNADVLAADDRLIIGGEPLLDPQDIGRIIAGLPSFDLNAPAPLIVNDTAHHPALQAVGARLERLIAVPIVSNQALLGTLLVINRQGDEDFTSIDARLVQSVVDRSAVYLENVLLYADLNKLLLGLTHALVNAIDAKDPYTCGHSNRVAYISRCIARQAGASPEQAERVYLSALLHDVGKIGVPESILCKSGRLTPEEVQHMRKHPEIGARILAGIKQLDDIIPGVLYHHEWLNGRGYPSGLRGEEIPWIARIIGVADAFDAMTSGRTYRSALPLSAAMAEIRRFSGTQFDPRLADALVTLVENGLAEKLLQIKS